MKVVDKFAAILGAITLLSGIFLVYDGQTLIGSSGSIVGGVFLLKGFGYLKDNPTNQEK